MKLKHRSRRQKRQHRNVIGFSQSFTPSVVSSDEDSDDDEFIHEGDSEPPEPSFSMEDSMLQEGADFFGTLEQMSKELDGLVRFVRRGVESLAGGTSEVSSSFEVLAFALEDWDL
jgi:gamma-tubulin complex component 5